MGKRTRTTTLEPLPEKPMPEYSSDVTVDGKEYTAITEGLATVLFPKRAVKIDKQGVEYEVQGEVFYNPIQQFNRDLSVLAIKTFADVYLGEKKARAERKKKSTGGNDAAVEETALPEPKRHKFAILDALSATGLRALRYTLELPMVTSATANDLDPSAVESIRRNIEYNKAHSKSADPATVSAAEAVGKIKPSLGNAQHHMYSVLSTIPGDRNREGRYEVIDLDPYGTAAPFLDAAVQAVSDGGMLCITCTDAGIWASTGYSEKCFSLYSGVPLKGECSHEAGLRLILHSVATAAGKYGLYIEPLLSLSIDFYARVWVRVRNGPQHVKKLASTTMIVYNCDEGCGSWFQQRIGKAKENTDKTGTGTFLKFGLSRAPTIGEGCTHCGGVMHLAGPMWGGPMHSADFVECFIRNLPEGEDTTYGTVPRMTGMLQTALLETELADSPFFVIPSRLSKTLHCAAPPNAALRGALVGLGYKVARSHCKPNSIKTNASHGVIWEVMKRWTELQPRKEGLIKEGMPGFKIMQAARNEELNIVFDKKLGMEADKMKGVVRYQVNPTANWGPMAKAGSGKPLEKSTPKEDDALETETHAVVQEEEMGETPEGKKRRLE